MVTDPLISMSAGKLPRALRAEHSLHERLRAGSDIEVSAGKEPSDSSVDDRKCDSEKANGSDSEVIEANEASDSKLGHWVHVSNGLDCSVSALN